MRVIATGLGLGLLTLVVPIAGCDDDPEPAAGEGCARLSADGGSLSSSDGVLTISVRPGSLEDSIELCIEEADAAPAGPPEVFSAAYRVRPDIDLDVDASITFIHPMPEDQSTAAIGAILREDFEAGDGRWIPLNTNRFDPDQEIISASDTRLSMFYGILDDATGE